MAFGSNYSCPQMQQLVPNSIQIQQEQIPHITFSQPIPTTSSLGYASQMQHLAPQIHVSYPSIQAITNQATLNQIASESEWRVVTNKERNRESPDKPSRLTKQSKITKTASYICI